jgi:hypothetical protein
VRTVPLRLRLSSYLHLFQGFHHPAYDSAKSIWSLECVPLLRKFIFAVKDADKNDLVNKVIDAFVIEVAPIMDSLEKGEFCLWSYVIVKLPVLCKL